MSTVIKSPEESTPDLQPFTRTDGERIAAIRGEVVKMRDEAKAKCYNRNVLDSVLDLIDRECAK